MDLLHALLLSQPIGVDKDQPLPKWLSALLLATESLIVLAEEPKSVAMVLPSQSVEISKLFAGSSYTEARASLFDLCTRLLAMQSLPCDELIAPLRLLVQ